MSDQHSIKDKVNVLRFLLAQHLKRLDLLHDIVVSVSPHRVARFDVDDLDCDQLVLCLLICRFSMQPILSVESIWKSVDRVASVFLLTPCKPSRNYPCL